MAKIHTEEIVIKFSRLVKDSQEQNNVKSVISADLTAALEQVAQELVDDNVIVELDRV